MRRKNTAKLLENLAGWEDIQFVIPYFLLPPKLFAASQRRNLIIQVSTNYQVYGLWQHSCSNEWLTFSAPQFRILVARITKRATHYFQDLRTFSRFLDENAITPDCEPKYWEPNELREKEIAEQSLPENSDFPEEPIKGMLTACQALLQTLAKGDS